MKDYKKGLLAVGVVIFWFSLMVAVLVLFARKDETKHSVPPPNYIDITNIYNAGEFHVN